ncbi:SET domain-containing protein [Peniophora sp. CONT]|nr:SET domain-containing protein [Peniophora sp. CONT]
MSRCGTGYGYVVHRIAALYSILCGSEKTLEGGNSVVSPSGSSDANASKTLQELETEWSNAAREQGAEGVTLVNDVDSELPGVPSGFNWLESGYTCLPGYEPDTQCLLHCENCSLCGIDAPCECIKADDEEFDGAYDQGLLRGPLIDCKHGFVIHECNPTCQCGDTCLNKVSQGRRSWIPEIFKTSNGRGWGVRTQADLKRGQILGIYYTGELLPSLSDDGDQDVENDKAEDGDMKADNDEPEAEGDMDDNYTFALDGNSVRDDKDAYGTGNWTRFANHSCDPNMRTYSRSLGETTRPDNQELLYLVLVAKQDIPARTELTFDYRPGATDLEAGQGQPCLCEAANCRGQVWA